MDGEGGKRDGMDRAKRHSDPEWYRCMLICAQEVARNRPFFTTDEVVKLKVYLFPNATTHEQRAIGPLMKDVAKLGYCVRTGDWHESSQAQNHRRPQRMWSSLIYRGPPPKRRPRRVVPDPRQGDLFNETA